MTRDQRQRQGHALLGIVALCAILLAAFVAWAQPGPPNDWECPAGTIPRQTCLDVNFDSK